MISSLLILLSYLYGSIPFALVIGKVFYKTDIRKHGSGNLGGTNAGRTLGKVAGVAVIVLDASKAFVVMKVVASLVLHFGLCIDLHYICALFCVIGHCYPIFAGFKGGKAVSTAIGFFFSINVTGAILSLVIFFILLKLTKYVSLSSVVASLSVLICSPLLKLSTIANICLAIIILLVAYRHIENFKRIMQGEERKISWM